MSCDGRGRLDNPKEGCLAPMACHPTAGTSPFRGGVDFSSSWVRHNRISVECSFPDPGCATALSQNPTPPPCCLTKIPEHPTCPWQPLGVTCRKEKSSLIHPIYLIAGILQNPPPNANYHTRFYLRSLSGTKIPGGVLRAKQSEPPGKRG